MRPATHCRTTASRRPRALLALVAALTLAVPGRLRAQAPAPAGAASAPAEHCTPDVKGLGDSLTYMVGAAARAFDPAQKLGDEYVQLVAQEIGTHLRLPRPIALDVYSVGYVVRGPRDTLWVAHADLGALLAVTLDRTGRLMRSELLTSTLDPVLDDSLRAAMTETGADLAFPPMPPEAQGDSAEIRVVLVTYDERKPVPSVPLFRIRVPVVRGVTPSHPLPGNHLGTLPDMRGVTNPSGLVELHVVVGTDGRIVPQALWVEDATDVVWLRAVGDAIAKFKYEPARVKGCPIMARDKQTFRLSMPAAQN